MEEHDEEEPVSLVFQLECDEMNMMLDPFSSVMKLVVRS